MHDTNLGMESKKHGNNAPSDLEIQAGVQGQAQALDPSVLTPGAPMLMLILHISVGSILLLLLFPP